MRQGSGSLAGVFLVGVFVAACGGKVDDPVGHAASDQQSAGSGGSGGAAHARPHPCPRWGGVAGGACIEMYESANCGATAYTVQCTCPGPCDCIVNGETVDTARRRAARRRSARLPTTHGRLAAFPRPRHAVGGTSSRRLRQARPVVVVRDFPRKLREAKRRAGSLGRGPPATSTDPSTAGEGPAVGAPSPFSRPRAGGIVTPNPRTNTLAEQELLAAESRRNDRDVEEPRRRCVVAPSWPGLRRHTSGDRARPWTVGHWPSQDGPNHLAVAHVLATYADPGSPFPQYWSAQTGSDPRPPCTKSWPPPAASLPPHGREMHDQPGADPPAGLGLLFAWRAVPQRAANVLLSLPLVLGFAFGWGFSASSWRWPSASSRSRSVGAAPVRGRRRAVAWRHGVASLAYFLCLVASRRGLMTGLALVLLEWRALLRWRAWLRVLVVVGPAAVFLVGAYLAAEASPPSSVDSRETFFSDR